MLAGIVLLLFIFVTGLCIGSFLNVVILRALSNESIVFPASKCPKCQNPLKWWHNIPVFSYIFLRGKCAFCKEKISIQYPLIELFTGIIFTLLFLKFGLSLDTLYTWIVASILIVLAGTDIKEKVVFDLHTFILLGVCFLYSAFTTALTFYQIKHGLNITDFTLWNSPLVTNILGAVEGVIIMEILARSGYLFAGTRAFGEGDTYIAAGLGMLFGWHNLHIVLIMSIVIQLLLFIPVFLVKLVKSKDFKTLISLTAFIAYAAAFCSLQKSGYITSSILELTGVALLIILGILTCFMILKGLKENPQSSSYLPFGPAMVIAAFIGMLI